MWIVQLALRRPYTFIVVALLLLIIGPLVGGYLVSAKLGWNRLFLLAALPAISAAIAMAALAAARQRDGERQ